jgi:hypothetical protein
MTDNEDLAAPADEDAEAANIWAEIEAEEAKTDTTDKAPSPAGDRDEYDGAADADEDKAEPEPEAQDVEETPAAAAEPDDPWATVPQAIREQFERERLERQNLELQFNRERGRTSSLTKKIEALTPRSAPKEPAKRAEDLQKLREEYPEVAEPLLGVIDELQGQVGALTSAVQTTAQQKSLDEVKALRDVHPDYLEVVQKHQDEVDAWIRDERHPRWVLRAYEENGQQIVDSKAVIKIMNEFKAFKGLPLPHLQRKEPAAAPAAKPQPSLADKRKRQLEGSITPTSQRSTTPAGHSDVPEEGDPEEIWAAIDRKEQRKLARR